MAISVTNITLDGRSCPWALGSGSPHTGGAGILTPYNTAFWDGTQAASGSAAQNAAYAYGKNHTTAGEQPPSVLTGLTPGQIVFLQYLTGTVATGGTGAGNSPPTGSATTGLTPLPAGGSDTETMASNVVPGRYAGRNLTGTVNTSGTTVTWVSGSIFSGAMIGATLWINNAAFVVSSVTSATVLVLTATAGTQTGVTFYMWGAATSIGGIVGAFTDSSGNVVAGGLFDWNGWGGQSITNANFTLTAVATASGSPTNYTGTITGGGSNAFAGYYFTIAGFTTARNNGTYFCTASSTTTITLVNLNALSETHAATASPIMGIQLRVPAGATQMSLGINDTDLHDNTGSFSLTAIVLDDGLWVGDRGFFTSYPFSQCYLGRGFDHPALKATACLVIYNLFQAGPGQAMVPQYAGQLFPHGAQQSGGSPAGTCGQNFPY